MNLCKWFKFEKDTDCLKNTWLQNNKVSKLIKLKQQHNDYNEYNITIMLQKQK